MKNVLKVCSFPLKEGYLAKENTTLPECLHHEYFTTPVLFYQKQVFDMPSRGAAVFPGR